MCVGWGIEYSNNKQGPNNKDAQIYKLLLYKHKNIQLILEDSWNKLFWLMKVSKNLYELTDLKLSSIYYGMFYRQIHILGPTHFHRSNQTSSLL